MSVDVVGVIQHILAPVVSAKQTGSRFDGDRLPEVVRMLGDVVEGNGSESPFEVRRLVQLANHALQGGQESVCYERLQSLSKLVAHGTQGAGVPGACGQAVSLGGDLNRVVKQVSFETYDSPLGRGVRFTQPAETSLAQMVEAINAEAQQRFHRDAICTLGQQGQLLIEDPGMTAVPQEPVVHDFILLVNGSNGKTGERQVQYLAEKGLSPASRAVVMVAGGLFRLESYAFPKHGVGTLDDMGDLFVGQMVRTARDSTRPSGLVHTSGQGIVHQYGREHLALENIFAAGAPSSKF